MFAQLGNNEALAKEEQRIAAKRAINEQRKQRILNPRIRTIGIDVSALDQQVIEKQNKLEMLKEEARMEKLVALETERVLAASAEEEKMMRKFQMDEMKKSWNEEIHQRRVNSSFPETRLEPENCGMAAAQKFAGEDENKYARSLQQKEQMRKWIQEQMNEKANINAKDKNDNLEYGNLMRAINIHRANQEVEDQQMRNYSKQVVNEENAILAARQIDRKSADSRQWKERPLEEILKATSIDLHIDDSTSELDSPTGKIRKDAFRGYTAKQNRMFLQQNEVLIQEKERLRHIERQREFDWAMQERYVHKALEQGVIAEQYMRQQKIDQQVEVLKQQMEENERYRKWHTDDRKVGFSKEFFESFGKSAR